ncbi:MAG: hypothetical protein HZB44_03495 [Actinobacteria bacterium]|nr:hypothetical protein [Actinomycetota bacterium]
MDTEQEKEFENKIEAKIEAKFEDGFCGSGKKTATQNGSAGAVWFLGFIGAVVYYIKYADGFWDGVLGVLKAFVWPAFLVYEAMKALAM